MGTYLAVSLDNLRSSHGFHPRVFTAVLVLEGAGDVEATARLLPNNNTIITRAHTKGASCKGLTQGLDTRITSNSDQAQVRPLIGF